MIKDIICTLCPNGCEIKVEYTDRDNTAMAGNRCDRGLEYAFNECFDPRRTFTGNVDIKGNYRKRMPVRSDKPIPKERLLDCADRLQKIRLEAPVAAGFIVIENIFDSGANIVTAMSIEKEG